MTNKTSGMRAFFWLVIIALPLLFIELFLRSYFAIQVGPGVFLYGLYSSKQQEYFDPQGYTDRNRTTNHTVDEIDNPTERPSDSPLLGYVKYAPHQETVDHNDAGEVFSVSINSRGFRGKEFETVKQAGTLRVLVLGASSTFGYHDKDDETYPVYLEDSLSEKLKTVQCRNVKRIEVINFGIPHLTTDNIYSLFMAEGLSLNPDVVTFYEGINDAHQDRTPGSAVGKAKSIIKNIPLTGTIYEWLRTHSISVALLANLNSTLATLYSASDVRLHSEGRPERFMLNVTRIYEECKKRNILFVAMNQQAKSGIIERENLRGVSYQKELSFIRQKLEKGKIMMNERDLITHDLLMKSLQDWATTNQVPFVDVIGALDSNRTVLVTWVHLIPEGNRIIASVLSDKILENICVSSVALKR